MGNDLNTLRSKLFVPLVSSVLRPTVEALGRPLPSTQRTSRGLTQTPVSGLRKPVAQFSGLNAGASTARLFKEALGLPTSGRSVPGTASLFRSNPFRTVNGVPD